MSFPLVNTVGHSAYSADGRDAHGNIVGAWSDPVDVLVYGWSITTTQEPQVAGHDRLLVDAQVLAPETFRPEPKDRIVLPHYGQFEVIGETEDFNHGPFGFRPGNVVSLRRVTG